MECEGLGDWEERSAEDRGKRRAHVHLHGHLLYRPLLSITFTILLIHTRLTPRWPQVHSPMQCTRPYTYLPYSHVTGIVPYFTTSSLLSSTFYFICLLLDYILSLPLGLISRATVQTRTSSYWFLFLSILVCAFPFPPSHFAFTFVLLSSLPRAQLLPCLASLGYRPCP